MQTNIFNFEIERKTFHIYALIIPLIYFLTSKLFITSFLLFLAICVLYIDISRHSNLKVRYFVDKFFGNIIRPEERSGSFKLSGSSFMILGFLLTALFFSKGLVISSWFILIISDALAALVGTKIGTKLDNGKSIVGSIAFLVSAIFISIMVYFFISYNTSFVIIIVSSMVATIAEFYSKEINIDDNFLIPVSYCLSTFFCHYLLGL